MSRLMRKNEATHHSLVHESKALRQAVGLAIIPRNSALLGNGKLVVLVRMQGNHSVSESGIVLSESNNTLVVYRNIVRYLESQTSL